MRLIDADVMDYSIIRYLPKSFESIESLCDAWKKLVENQPTAYDVDKVVERLERDSQDIALIYPTDQGYDYEDAIGIDINKAKEIVKSGGIV